MNSELDKRVSLIDFYKNKFHEIELNINEEIISFTNFDEEYESATHSVGIKDHNTGSFWKLTGKDTLDFLQRISTNDIKELKHLSKVNTLFTNSKGRMIDKATLVNIKEDYFLIGSKDPENMLYRWLDRYIITEDIKIEKYSEHYAIFEIIGPKAESFLIQICGKEVVDLTENSVLEISLENLKFYLVKQASVNGEPTYWIISYKIISDSLIDMLLASDNLFTIKMIGDEAYNSFRVERGIPEFNYEITDDFNPHELDMLDSVSFNKGCYIGQEVIARLDTYDKVSKHLKGIIFESEIVTELPFEVFDENGDSAGVITSLAYSPKLKKQIGLGVIRKKYIEENKKLILNKKIPNSLVTIMDLPF